MIVSLVPARILQLPPVRGHGRTAPTSGRPIYVFSSRSILRCCGDLERVTVQNRPAAYPRAFHCEHTPSKSRIHALVHHTGGPATLTAVLTLNDPELAEQAARVLNQALDASPGPVLREAIEQVTRRLPAAPRASLTQALAHLGSGTWPVPQTPPWPALDEADEQREVPRRLADQFARTPNLARLAQHPGPVMRIGRLLESHVHDPARTLQAAIASGWQPEQDEDLDDQLLDAVMWLTDEVATIPGADIITDASNGQSLSSGSDEVADWSEQPVTFDFGRGYLLTSSHTEDESQSPAKHRESRPDYATLFRLPDCEHPDTDEQQDESEECEQCDSYLITPRTAAVLSFALTLIAEQCDMDIDDHGDQPVDPHDSWQVFDELPRITWRQNADWRLRFAQAARDLALDLDHGQWPLPTCTAEEVALNLALDEAQAVRELAEIDDKYAREVIGDLPEHPRDYDWEACSEDLYQDTDFLFLYNNATDGIEDPDTDENKHLGIGDLRAANWFETFLNMHDHKQERAEDDSR